ncbi:MAG: hypothetical protein H0S84_00830 [Bacteroidales bacterium]|nr:hypothetical protein [Bacteroidales bacterium]
MESTIITMMIVGLIVGSAIGGGILMILAKYVGKVSNAKYGNSFMVCLLASAINYFIWYLIGVDAYKMSFFSIFALNVVILSILYIVIGKIVWKCTWRESFMANIIWIVLYAAFMGYGLSQLS